MNLNAADWAIVAAYFVLSAGIGFAFTKRGGESMTEYFIAGTEPVQECTTHSPFNMGQPFDTTARPGLAPGTKPTTPAKRDTTTNPFKIP